MAQSHLNGAQNMPTCTLWHIKHRRDVCLDNFHCLIEGLIWWCGVLAAEAFLSSFLCVMAHFKQYLRFVSMYLRALVHFESLLNWSLMVMLATLSWSIAYAISKLLSCDTIQSANSCTTPSWHGMIPRVDGHCCCGHISVKAEADQLMQHTSDQMLRTKEAVQRLCHPVMHSDTLTVNFQLPPSAGLLLESTSSRNDASAVWACYTWQKHSIAVGMVMGYHRTDQETLTLPHMPLTSAIWVVS